MWQCSMSADTGSTGQSKFARTVCGGADAKHADQDGADRSALVCVNLKFFKSAAMINGELKKLN